MISSSKIFMYVHIAFLIPKFLRKLAFLCGHAHSQDKCESMIRCNVLNVDWTHAVHVAKSDWLVKTLSKTTITSKSVKVCFSKEWRIPSNTVRFHLLGITTDSNIWMLCIKQYIMYSFIIRFPLFFSIKLLYYTYLQR